MTDPTLVPVAVACPCPGTPHDGDTVYLHPTISLKGGSIAQRKFIDMSGGGTDADEVFGSLIEVYVRYGVAETTLTGEDGNDLSLEQAIGVLLGNFALGSEVATKADELYSKALLDPLLAQVSTSSRRSQTNGSTSRRNPSRATRQKPSKPSSTPTSQTADTATTSS